MNLKFRTSLIAFSAVFYACESDRIVPIVDCDISNLQVTSISAVNANCGGSNGSLTVAGSGGQSPYLFSINDGNFGPDSVFTNLSFGSYTVQIKDANECTNSLQAAINNTGEFSIQTSIENTNCSANDGSITITTVGGEPPFQYKLGSGNFGDANLFNGLGSGSYTVSAKDANGCEALASVQINNSTNVALSVVIQSAGCKTQNGSITLEASGGTSPYLFKLGNGNFVSSNTFDALPAGSYTLTAKDANGCEETKTEKVLSGVKFSTSISSIIQSNCASSSCHGGNQNPNLSSLANIQANATAIKNATSNKTMPKNGSLTQSQIDAIACWVNDGAPNN